jgi:hypothetical protein
MCEWKVMLDRSMPLDIIIDRDTENYEDIVIKTYSQSEGEKYLSSRTFSRCDKDHIHLVGSSIEEVTVRVKILNSQSSYSILLNQDLDEQKDRASLILLAVLSVCLII